MNDIWEVPMFEIMRISDGHMFKVFLDGHIEGFDSSEEYGICNRYKAFYDMWLAKSALPRSTDKDDKTGFSHGTDE